MRALVRYARDVRRSRGCWEADVGWEVMRLRWMYVHGGVLIVLLCNSWPLDCGLERFLLVLVVSSDASFLISTDGSIAVAIMKFWRVVPHQILR